MKIQNPNRNFKNIKKISNNKEDYDLNTNFLNKDRFDRRHRDVNDKARYYNNTNISDRHGQENIEYSLFILSSQILYSSFIVYIYLYELENLLFILFCISGILDLIILTFYVYFVIKFNKDEIFTDLPKSCISWCDMINIMSMSIKVINFFLLFLLSKQIDFNLALCFIIKFITDLYFFIISIKIYMFCPYGVWCSDLFNKIWLCVKYYLFCCEIDDSQSSDMEYSRMEDMESFY